MIRKKPEFIRRDWHKKIRFSRKKKLKWRHARGMDNKTRLAFKGYPCKVKIGWGSKKENKPMAIRVESMKELASIKNHPVIIGSVGKKKRNELIAKAKEMKLTILNKYRAAHKASALRSRNAAS